MMHLVITEPTQVVVDHDDVVSVRAEDASGSFGILTGHADLITALTPSVVAWRQADGGQGWCAVRRGVLSVRAGREVAIATRQAQCGDDLASLEQARAGAVPRRTRCRPARARVGDQAAHGGDPRDHPRAAPRWTWSCGRRRMRTVRRSVRRLPLPLGGRGLGGGVRVRRDHRRTHPSPRPPSLKGRGRSFLQLP